MKFTLLYSKFLFLSFFLTKSLTVGAQQTDSIKYEHGFLYFHEYGSKNLPVIIILTGGPGNSYRQLEGLAETMSSKFRCIILEQRGTGKSIPNPLDSTTINIQAATQDVDLLLNYLELDKANILGHSWGGMLAMKFASEYPEKVKKLILVAPGPHKNAKNGFDVLFTNRKHTRSLEEELRLSDLAKQIANSEADSLKVIEFQKLSRRAYIFENPVPDSTFMQINTGNNPITAELLWNNIIEDFDGSKTLANYSGTIDVITGRQDVVGFFSYELKLDFPQTNLHWINECGHFPMYEKPNEFYSILKSILK